MEAGGSNLSSAEVPVKPTFMGAGWSNISSAEVPVKPAISWGLVGLISLVQRFQSNQLFHRDWWV